MKEAMQDCHCHPGVKGIADAEIEQIVHGPGHGKRKEDKVKKEQHQHDTNAQFQTKDFIQTNHNNSLVTELLLSQILTIGIVHGFDVTLTLQGIGITLRR